MSDAIEFGIGGNNDGFVAALKDSERKAQESGGKVTKSLTEAGKKSAAGMKAGLDSIAGDFSRVTSGVGALELAIDKVGGSLKAVGAVAGIAAIGKKLYDARQEAVQFEKDMRRINQSNTGNASNFSIGDLEGNLLSIKERRRMNLEESSSVGGRLGQVSNAYANNFLNIVTGQGTETAKKLNSTPENRDDELKVAQLTAEDRLLQKQKEIFKIQQERVKGNREAVELAELEAEYAEQIQKATDNNQQERAGVLTDQKKLAVSALKTRQEVEEIQRKRMVGEADVAARQAQEAATMDPESAQREKFATDIRMADLAVGDAQESAKANPNKKDAAAQIEIAEKKVLQITAERDRWEKEITRSKADALKSAISTGEEIEAETRGQKFVAGQVKQKAASEQAATNALRQGNTELAAQITKTDAILTKQKAIAALTDPNSGRARPVGEIRAEQRASVRKADRQEKAYQRASANEFITGATRDMGGNITGGIDILTGERVEKRADGLFYDQQRGSLSKRYGSATDADGNSYRVDEYGKWSWTGSGQEQAGKEMAHKQSKGQQKAKTASDNAKAAAANAEGGGGTLHGLVTSIEKRVKNAEGILQSWDRE